MRDIRPHERWSNVSNTVCDDAGIDSSATAIAPRSNFARPPDKTAEKYMFADFRCMRCSA